MNIEEIKKIPALLKLNELVISHKVEPYLVRTKYRVKYFDGHWEPSGRMCFKRLPEKYDTYLEALAAAVTLLLNR